MVPVLLLIFFFYISNTQKKMEKIKIEVSGSSINGHLLQLAIADPGDNKTRWFNLKSPLSVCRENNFQALTVLKRPLGPPIGALDSTAHISANQKENEKSLPLTEIPADSFNGLVLLLDLSKSEGQPSCIITEDLLRKKLESNQLPISILAIKTSFSAFPQDHVFGETVNPKLSAKAAHFIDEYRFPTGSDGKGKNKRNRLVCLLVDFPALDKDGTAERILHDGEKKRLVVLSAWFSRLKEGYYYAVIAPPRFREETVSPGITFMKLEEVR